MDQTTTQQMAPVTSSIYPVEVIIPRQERYSRLLALCTLLLMIPKFIISIPHLIVLYILSIVVVIVGILGQLAVLFTGKYPRSLFQFTAGVVRWQARMTAYLYGLTDIYPPFSISK